MKRVTMSTSIPLDGAGAVERDAGGTPVAFRLWRNGTNETSNGPVVFDEEAATNVMAARAARANGWFAIDYEHLSISPDAPPAARIAAGTLDIDVRADGGGGVELWAVEVKWTEAARVGIARREWLSVSPTVSLDDKTRRMLSLYNVALTNSPATAGATLLAASRQAAERPRPRPTRASSEAARLDAAFGIESGRPLIRKEGSVVCFSVMTPEEARQHSRGRSSRLPKVTRASSHAAQLDAAFGMRSEAPAIRRDGNTVSFGHMTPEEAQVQFAARREKGWIR